ncbi:MAG TPA: Phenylacetic acid catabolic protein [Candidatus Binatia bacterium]|nr:Phenylacetic acid catabolic protein [Candidatus Binatia bacterium]
MFEDKVDRDALDKMPDEYKDLLSRVLTIQADCEIGGPHLYVKDMLPNAPSKINQLIVARTAAEEMDHYRKIARLAGEIGVDTSFLLSVPNQKRYLEAFRGLITSWEDFSVFGFLIDRVGRFQLEEFLDCSYLPLQKILPDILKEEMGHIGFGTNQTAEMALKGGGQQEKIQKSVDFWYIKALDMFGRSDSERSNRYCNWGLKRRSNTQARWEFKKEVDPLIQQMGLEVPDPIAGRQYL